MKNDLSDIISHQKHIIPHKQTTNPNDISSLKVTPLIIYLLTVVFVRANFIISRLTK